MGKEWPRAYQAVNLVASQVTGDPEIAWDMLRQALRDGTIEGEITGNVVRKPFLKVWNEPWVEVLPHPSDAARDWEDMEVRLNPVHLRAFIKAQLPAPTEKRGRKKKHSETSFWLEAFSIFLEEPRPSRSKMTARLEAWSDNEFCGDGPKREWIRERVQALYDRFTANN
jgi:hypothetical protein